MAPHDDVLALLVEIATVQDLVAVVLVARLKTQPGVSDVEVNVLTDGGAKHRIAALHLIAVVVLHVTAQRVVTGAADALVVI